MSIHMVTFEELQVTAHTPAYNFVIRDGLVSSKHALRISIFILKLHVLSPRFNHFFSFFFLIFSGLLLLVLVLLGLTMLFVELLA